MPPSALPSPRLAKRPLTRSRRRAKAALFALACCIGFATPATAQTESILLNFAGTSGASQGGNPYSSNLIQASDGNFYGTTFDGGPGTATGCHSGCGIIFKMTPGGVYTVLHSFLSGTSDGAVPYGPLIQGIDGNFYGTTNSGGSGTCTGTSGCGTIFEITSSGTFTLLHSFSGISDGQSPSGGLVQGTDGSLFGTTYIGGAGSGCLEGCGTVFKITPSGTFTLLHSFTETMDGAGVLPGLVQGADGSFYGVASGGGAHNQGTVFKITPSGIVTTLHSFAAGTTDGSTPYARLVQGTDGDFYGTTISGGSANCTGGCGTLFKISSTGTFTLLYALPEAEGSFIQAGLVLATDGNYYGAAYEGGSTGGGTVFNVTSTGALTILHSFSNFKTEGDGPLANPIQGSDGNFYGLTMGGGTLGDGTIFKLTPATPLPGPITLTVPSAVTPSASFSLTYSVYNAYSATLQQCFATNTAGVTDWTGILTGLPTTQTTTLTAPTTAGTYTYALTCGGMESGFATLNVAGATYIPTTSVSAITPPFGSTTAVTVTATESGAAGAVTGGIVTFSVLSPATGTFSPTTCTLAAAGTCTTNYTPTGTLAAATYSNDIQASFAAVNSYTAATTNNTLTITPASTSTLTEPVGTTSSGQIAIVTITTSGTLGAINYLTQGAPNLDFKQTGGGTVNHQPCTVGNTYNAGDTCATFYTFTPTHPGIRYGGITLSTTSGTLLGNAYIYGLGTGPQITWAPDQQAVLDNGLNNPRGMAVDGKGNTYVALNGSLLQISAAGAIRTIPFSGDLQDVAVDGSGNVFVANASYASQEVVNEIVAVNGSIPATPEIRTFTGFGTVWGVAVDRNGDLFVTQSYSTGTYCALYELPAVNGSIPATPTTLTLATTFGVSPCDPYGIAFDAGGNLFVADPQASAIYELLAVNGTIPASPTIQTVESGLIDPAYIALDAAGDIFAADFRSTVYEMLAVNGTVPTTNPTILKLGSGLQVPSGVAVDESGNVFISDTGLNQIFKLNYSNPPTLTFATTPVGQTSVDSPKSVTMTNDGNEPLIFQISATGINPAVTQGFTLSTAAGNLPFCPQYEIPSSGQSLAAGASCIYGVNFTPYAPILISGFLVPTDNNLNVVNSTQQVPLNGTGTAAPPAPTVINITPNSGPTSGGTSVTITGTNFGLTPAVKFGTLPAASVTVISATQVTAVSPAAPAGPVDVTVTTSLGGTSVTSPADVFTFIASQTINFPAPTGTAYAGTAVLLTATASSGLPVSYTVVSGPAVVSGNVLTYTGAGTVVVEADQAGNTTIPAATPVQITIVPTLLTEPVGTLSPIVSTVVSFTATGTVATVNSLTQGATKADFASQNPVTTATCQAGTTYAAGQYCTASFTFTPDRPGLRYGGVTLTSSTGEVLASTYIYGMGVGPMVTYSPGTQTAVGSGLIEPTGVTEDGNGNIFVSGYGAVGLQEIAANTGIISTIGQFNTVDDVAIDGLGNLFVASNRTTVSEVLAVNGVIPANPAIVTLATSFISLNGIKVDANGNVFLASGDSSGATGMIYEIPVVNGVIPANPTIIALYALNGGPTGVAIDSSNNVYYSDGVTNSVNELLAVNGVIPPTPTVRTLGNGFGQLANIALDDANDVFTVDYTNHLVREILAVNGVVPASNPTILTLGSGFGVPSGIFIDGSGTVFVADEDLTAIAKIDTIDPPVLNFASTYIGFTSSDSPQTVTVMNDGNAPLVYTVPNSGPNPTITPGFTIGSASTCPQLTASSTSTTLDAGVSCTNVVSFTPIAPGPDSGKLVTTDNDLNVPSATQTVLLNGTGKVQPPAVITLTASPNPVFLNNPVTLTASVTSTVGAPTGTVLFLDTNASGSTPLGTATISGGSATLTTSTLTLGTHNITAIYSGDNIFATQTSNQVTELVEDFSLVILNPTLDIKHGGTAVYNLVVTTVGGTFMASDIGFTIAGSPDHSPVTFSPVTVVTGSGTTNVNLTIQTPDYPVGPWSSIAGPRIVFALTLFGALLLPFGKRRRQLGARIANLARLLLFLAALTSLTTLTGCANYWGPQHYPITVTATSGALSHSANAILTSQP